ncbi:MAG: M56 family metallopeptidase [Saprospiraceae bacterium]
MNILMQLWESQHLLGMLFRGAMIIAFMYLPYELIFRKHTSFLANRVYLLGLMLSSVVIPFISINVFPEFQVIAAKEKVISNLNEVLPVGLVWYKDFSFLFRVIYFFGVIIASSAFFFRLFKILRIIATHKHFSGNTYTLVICPELSCSSFFSYVFFHKPDIDSVILEHEKVHISQYHSIDLIIFEILKSIFWFHPLVYMTGRALRESHEYFCDQVVTENKIDHYSYASILLQQVRSEPQISLTNNFYSLIKNRIKMMHKLKNQTTSARPYFAMMLTIAITFMMFSFKSYKVAVDEKGERISLDSIPQFFLLIDTVQYEKIIDGTLQKSSYIVTNKLPVKYYMENYNKTEVYSDTLIELNPDTWEEKVSVVSGKFNKLYRDLITQELRKDYPDQDLIKKWQKQAGK